MEIMAIVLATAYEQTQNTHDSMEDGIVHLGALYSGIYAMLFSGYFEMPMIIDKLPVFYKQRDLRFYPSWAFSVTAAIIQIPVSLLEVTFYILTTYYMMGFNPSVLRSISQLSTIFTCVLGQYYEHRVDSVYLCSILFHILSLSVELSLIG